MLLTGAGTVFVLILTMLALLSRPDIRTRLVLYQGERCTEYFDTKDGMEVQLACPSRGGEWYVDTTRVTKYPPGFPIERSR